MAIASTDLLFKLSEKSGAAGDTVAGTPAGSLGKYVSTTEITTATLHNLFDVVTGDENADSDVEYRCIFIHNNHATLALTAAVVWLSAEVENGCAVAIAVDDIAPTAKGQAGAQADEIADESTAPGAGVGAFSSPVSKATGLALGDIPVGYVQAIWVRRTAANTAALANDGATIRVEGNTEP